MRRLRVGVIGVGYLGKFHAEKYARMDEVDLVGVADIEKSIAEDIAKKFDTKAYQNYNDFYGKVDAVSIVVPTHGHFMIAKDLLENGVDVLIEKPITTTLEEADELISISEEKGLIIQVGHLERFNPAVVVLNGIVENPMFIESHRLSTYKERGTDVSVVHDLMIHDIDIILNFVRSDINSIRASGIPVVSDNIDIANSRLEFGNGCVANVTASRISIKNERKIRMFQKDTYISVDFVKQEITVIKQDGKENDGLIPGMSIKQLNFTKRDALEDELKSFVKAVVKREEPEVSGQVGRHALEVALGIMEQINDTCGRFLG